MKFSFVSPIKKKRFADGTTADIFNYRSDDGIRVSFYQHPKKNGYVILEGDEKVAKDVIEAWIDAIAIDHDANVLYT